MYQLYNKIAGFAIRLSHDFPKMLRRFNYSEKNQGLGLAFSG